MSSSVLSADKTDLQRRKDLFPLIEGEPHALEVESHTVTVHVLQSFGEDLSLGDLHILVAHSCQLAHVSGKRRVEDRAMTAANRLALQTRKHDNHQT